MFDFRVKRWASCGMLLAGLGMGMLAGCGSKSEPAVAETKKFRPVDESSPAGDGTADAANAIQTGEVARAKFASRGNAAQESARSEATPPGPTPKDGAVGGELLDVLKKMDRLSEQQPQGKSEREQLDDLIKIHTQRLGLAKQALKLNPQPELKRQIVVAMFEIYQTYAQYRVPSAMAQLADFGKTMSADADPEVARIGRHATFSANLSRIASQPLESGKDIVAEAQKLIEAEKGHLSPDTVQLAQQTANLLRQGGFRADAAAIYETVAAELANDPKQADEAAAFAVQAKLMKSDLETLLENVIREKPEADQKLAATIETLLKDGPLNREMFGNVQQVAHILEALGHFQVAQSTYEQLTAAFKDTKDAELADQVADVASKAKQRMALIGQPFTVEGLQVDGSPFDWSAYAGKVVLIDFWASWCGPCLQEMPNIRQNFEQYHAKGFDVVGVNLNTKVADLKQFLAFQGQDLPWATVTSQVVLDGKAGEDWTKIPMAAKCGVQAIPFVVLVGKDGKVDSIHVRGPKLGARLKELLGDPITSEVPADPTQPAKPPAKATGQRTRSISPLSAAVTAALALAGSKLGPGLLAYEKGSEVFAGKRLSISQCLAPTKTPGLLYVVSADPPADDTSNPYLAKPGLKTTELIAFIHKMLDRPQSIQSRPGFAAGLVDACDRVLKDDAATKSDQLFAIQTKLSILHREACDGKDAADKQLMAFVEELKNDDRPDVAREVAFFRLERRVLEAKELPLDEIPALLNDVQSYLADEKLTGKHLRLASSTVAAINRLESGDEREAQFAKFAPIFSRSTDKDLARYGKKLGKKSSE